MCYYKLVNAETEIFPEHVCQWANILGYPQNHSCSALLCVFPLSSHFISALQSVFVIQQAMEGHIESSLKPILGGSPEYRGHTTPTISLPFPSGHYSSWAMTSALPPAEYTVPTSIKTGTLMKYKTVWKKESRSGHPNHWAILKEKITITVLLGENKFSNIAYTLSNT